MQYAEAKRCEAIFEQGEYSVNFFLELQTQTQYFHSLSVNVLFTDDIAATPTRPGGNLCQSNHLP